MTDFSDAWAEAVAAAADEEIKPPSGEYDVEVVGAEAEVTQGGTEIARLRLRLANGDADGGVFEYPMFFTKKFSIERAAKTLHAFGVAVKDVHAFSELGTAMKAIVGTRARVYISYREFGGKEYLDIDVLEATPPPERPAEVPATTTDDEAPLPF